MSNTKRELVCFCQILRGEQSATGKYLEENSLLLANIERIIIWLVALSFNLEENSQVLKM